MTDALGAVTDSLDFAAFGERRASANPQAAGPGPNSNLTRRGFTGHEQFAGLNIIHMNGRIYDPSLGRFMQADPLIQAPTNAQSWNAYTYVFNNPLAYTDPTGNFSVRQVLAIAIGVVAAIYGQYYITHNLYAAAFGVTVAGGFASGYVATGSLRGGVQGAFSAALTFGVGLGDFGTYGNIAARAVTGGITESLQGGNFGNGFASAGLTAAVMPQIGFKGGQRVVVSALAGGAISSATGGKFANGAISGAIQGAMAGGTGESGRRGGWGDSSDQPSYSIGFDGAGGPEAGGNPDFYDLVESSGGNAINGGFFNEGTVASRHVSEVRDFIADNPNGNVIVYGYSRGGQTAVRFANMLGKAGIQVSSLINFDPHSAFGNLSLTYNNVDRAINFYQQNPTDRKFGVLPNTATNPYKGSFVSGARNFDMSGLMLRTNHINIIRQARNYYGNIINDAIP